MLHGPPQLGEPHPRQRVREARLSNHRMLASGDLVRTETHVPREVSFLDHSDRHRLTVQQRPILPQRFEGVAHGMTDRKSTRLNSSHSQISYAVFCLKKKSRIQTSSACGSRIIPRCSRVSRSPSPPSPVGACRNATAKIRCPVPSVHSILSVLPRRSL